MNGGYEIRKISKAISDIKKQIKQLDVRTGIVYASVFSRGGIGGAVK